MSASVPGPSARIRLCGALEVEIAGQRVERRLRGTQGRMLLAYLVLNRDRPIARAELEAALWGDDRPGPDALAPPLSRVRQVLGTERLSGRGRLQLRLGDDAWIDVEAARAALRAAHDAADAGDAEAAHAHAGTAAALTAGPLLDDLDARWIAVERARLRELHVEALEASVAAAIRLGDGRLTQAGEAARTVVTLAPYRESARVLLLEVLAAQGNVAEALVAFEDARRFLSDELGAVPGPLLLEAHARLLHPVAPTPATMAAPAWPSPATAIVGRHEDVSSVAELLRGPDVRLVTVTGPGGIGKTRLAIEVGRRLEGEFADGARFVALGEVRDPDLFCEALAGGLGLRVFGAQPAYDDVVASLRARETLLVLDNFEQIADAAPVVADLLGAAPALTVLATSRASLQLRGEHQRPLRALPDDPAVELFVQRARAADPHFAPSAQDRSDIAALVEALDGLPLAIELAAARIRLLSPAQMRSRLGSALDLLTAGTRDAPARQRTLRDTIAWSFDLLTADEQRLFTSLSVFAGGFDAAAAEAVHAAPDTLELLESLVDRSLVAADRDERSVRFSLLVTIREFAAERAEQTGLWAAARTRHAAHYRALADAASSSLHTDQQEGWLDRLERERHNVSAAIRWYGTGADMDACVEMGWSVWMLWWLRGYPAEAAHWARTVVAAQDGLAPHRRARALCGAAMQLPNVGEERWAMELLEQSIPLYRDAGDAAGLALAVGELGHLCSAVAGDHARAAALLDESLALYGELGDRWYRAAMTVMRGSVDVRAGALDEAAARFADAVVRARPLGDAIPLLMGLASLGRTQILRGEHRAAHAQLGDGLTIAAGLGDDASVADLLDGVASLAAACGAGADAAVLAGAAGRLRERAGSGWLRRYTGHPLTAQAQAEVEGHPDAVARGRDLDRDAAIGLAGRVLR